MFYILLYFEVLFLVLGVFTMLDPLFSRGCRRGCILPKPDMRRALYRCNVAHYLRLPITSSVQLICIVKDEQRQLRSHYTCRALTTEYF